MSARRFEVADLAPWIEFKFDRAGGPGGQNVNKTNTRVTLLFDFAACALLNGEDRARIRQRLESRLAQDGRLRIVSQNARTQPANREAAEQRLLELLTAAVHVPKVRRPTRPTRSSGERRMRAKRRRGQTKQGRQRTFGDE